MGKKNRKKCERNRAMDSESVKHLIENKGMVRDK
jgi:hypothetical protein